MHKMLAYTETLIALALIAILVSAAVWDIWALQAGNGSRTVSTVIYEWSQQVPMLPFTIGLILGHLIWPKR